MVVALTQSYIKNVGSKIRLHKTLPSYLNDMLMLLLNNYNTRSQMALDIPHCRTI